MDQCPECGEYLEFEIENNGFEPPDPPKYEVTAVWCPNCGWEEE